jgi:hypothetical protein
MGAWIYGESELLKSSKQCFFEMQRNVNNLLEQLSRRDT